MNHKIGQELSYLVYYTTAHFNQVNELNVGYAECIACR